MNCKNPTAASQRVLQPRPLSRVVRSPEIDPHRPVPHNALEEYPKGLDLITNYDLKLGLLVVKSVNFKVALGRLIISGSSMKASGISVYVPGSSFLDSYFAQRSKRDLRLKYTELPNCLAFNWFTCSKSLRYFTKSEDTNKMSTLQDFSKMPQRYRKLLKTFTGPRSHDISTPDQPSLDFTSRTFFWSWYRWQISGELGSLVRG